MNSRLLFLATMLTAIGSAAPMTIVFTGTATGSVGSTSFTNQAFTITFNSDTASVVQGTTCCAKDYTTPSGTPATYTIGSISGSLTDNQAVFDNQTEQTLGIWHFNEPDYLTVGHPSFTNYTLTSSIGPITGNAYSFPLAQSMASSKGAIVLQSVSGVNVQVTVGTGTVGTPTISGIGAAYGTGIAQNTWVAITGTNLVPNGTPAAGVTWSGAIQFASGQMPTSLNGVTVSVNGKPAYVEFYCSGSVAGSICTKDQINILTPLDDTIGPVQVVVSNGSVSSAPIGVTMAATAPSFLLFSGGYVTATHANYSLLGPTSLYPGYSTPATVGETVVLYMIGYGLPKTTLTQGSATQTGDLPVLPSCTISGATAKVVYAGVVSPGLYQFNVTIPTGAVSGDNPISCTYNGVAATDTVSTVITVK